MSNLPAGTDKAVHRAVIAVAVAVCLLDLIVASTMGTHKPPEGQSGAPAPPAVKPGPPAAPRPPAGVRPGGKRPAGPGAGLAGPRPGGGSSPGPLLQVALKPSIRGLIDRQKEPLPQYPVHAWVVEANWADIQPQQGGPIAANNVIDQAIAAARAANAKGAGMALKLRLYAGIASPAWAKQLGGPPFQVQDNQSKVSGTAPRFWTPQFTQAYAAVQAALAAKYDSVPEIREVVISQCTTVYDEPFIRQYSNPSVRNAMLAAGFTTAADHACEQSQIEAHQVWHHTYSDLAFNPYYPIEGFEPGGKGFRAVDQNLPPATMRFCRQALGARCLLENNSIRQQNSAPYQQLYQAMHQLAGPMAFQTATPDKVGDLRAVAAMAAGLGADSLELPRSYRSESPSQLAADLGPYVTEMQHNPPAY